MHFTLDTLCLFIHQSRWKVANILTVFSFPFGWTKSNGLHYLVVWKTVTTSKSQSCIEFWPQTSWWAPIQRHFGWFNHYMSNRLCLSGRKTVIRCSQTALKIPKKRTTSKYRKWLYLTAAAAASLIVLVNYALYIKKKKKKKSCKKNSITLFYLVSLNQNYLGHSSKTFNRHCG